MFARFSVLLDDDDFALLGVLFGSGWSRGGGWRLFTLFCRDCVVAVSVETRGSSAPAAAPGWMVERLLPLLRLELWVSAGFVEVSAAAMDDANALLGFAAVVVTPGPRDFRGGLAAVPGGGAAGVAVSDVEMELCRLLRQESSRGSEGAAVSFTFILGCDGKGCLFPAAMRCRKLGVRPRSSRCCAPTPLPAIPFFLRMASSSSSRGRMVPRPPMVGKSLNSGGPLGS